MSSRYDYQAQLDANISFIEVTTASPPPPSLTSAVARQGALYTVLVTSENGQLSDIQLDPATGTMFYVSTSNGNAGPSSR